MLIKFTRKSPSIAESKTEPVWINPAKVVTVRSAFEGTFIQHEDGCEQVTESLDAVVKSLDEAMDPLVQSVREQAAQLSKLTRPAE